MPDRSSIPTDLKEFIKNIQLDIPKLLGDTLFGIYVYGSISYGDFDERRSDVDIIVVIKRRLNDAEFRSLEGFYHSPAAQDSRWLGRLEMDYVTHSTLSRLKYVVTHSFKATHFAHGKLRRSANSDGGNPINWMNIRQCGIPLFGPRPKTFVPEINDELLLIAVKNGFGYIESHARKWIKESLWSQVFMVLMLCRIACTLKEGKMLSKEAATRWGARALPEKFRPTIEAALRHMNNTSGPIDKTLRDSIPGLVNYVGDLVHAQVV